MNYFLVNTGVLKKYEYIKNINDILQIYIPEKVKRMCEEIANEATALTTAETSKNKDEQFASMLKNKIYDKIKSIFISMSYNLIHNISIIKLQRKACIFSFCGKRSKRY